MRKQIICLISVLYLMLASFSPLIADVVEQTMAVENPGCAASRTAGSDAEVVYTDSFESGLGSWKVSRKNTSATVKSEPGGSLGRKCIEIIEKNSGGTVSISSPKITVKGGHWYSSMLDLQTIKTSAETEFFTTLVQWDANGKHVDTTKSPYSDGVSDKTIWSGFRLPGKANQAWVTHKQTIKLKRETASVSVGISVADNQCRLLIDNVRLVDEGQTEPKKTMTPAFAKQITSPGAATFKTELVPGFTYRIRLDTDSTDHRGMGLVMKWENFAGELSDPIRLPRVNEDGHSMWFDVQIPYQAMNQVFYTVNDDLMVSQWVKVDAYRNFTQVTVELLDRLPVKNVRFQMQAYTGLVKKGQNVLVDDYVTVSDFEKQAMATAVSKRKVEDAEVVIHNGGAAFKIGDDVVPPYFMCSLPRAPQNYLEYFKEPGKRGINIVRVLNANGGPGRNGQWKAPGEFDFSSLDKQIYRALKQNPKAYIILATGGVLTPPWWGNDNPDELIMNDKGEVLLTSDTLGFKGTVWAKFEKDVLVKALVHAGDSRKDLKYNRTFVASPTSPKYRNAMKEYLTALRQYIEKQPYAAAVIGYKLVWGYDGQWGIVRRRGSRYEPGKGISKSTNFYNHDYSKAMKVHFRTYLKNKYKTVAALRKAWGDVTVTFETASLPTPKERTMDINWRIPSKKKWPFLVSQNVTDFNTCYRQSVGMLLNDTAKALKEAHPRKIFTGAYFTGRVRDLGHEAVLKSPYLDFAGGVGGKGYGDAAGIIMFDESWRHNGKLAMNEADYRVFPFQEGSLIAGKLMATPRSTQELIRHGVSQRICTGGGLWFLDLVSGRNFSQPLVADMLGEAHDVFKQTLPLDKTSVAKMAMFVPAEFFNRRTPYPIGRTSGVMFAGLIKPLQKSGVAVDFYNMCDLEDVKDKYKIFLFPACTALSRKDKATIDSLKQKGNLLVFGPGAGYIIGEDTSVDQIKSLLGMEVEIDNSIPWHVRRVDDPQHPLAKAMPEFIGSSKDQPHIEYTSYRVTDSKAVPLGTSLVNQKDVICAFKDNGDWQSLYLGTGGYFPSSLFKAIAKYKKLRIYSEGDDAIYVSKEVIAIHATSTGMKTIKLPYPCHVKSLWDNKDIGVVTEIKRHMKLGETALYSCVKK